MEAVFEKANIEEQVRELTDGEVLHFRENGWVSLRGLVSKDLALALLPIYKDVIGFDHDELSRHHPDAQAVVTRFREHGPSDARYWNVRVRDERVLNVVSSRRLGEASARLSGFSAMRLVSEGPNCCLPGWFEEVGLGRHTKSSWHADLPYSPFDRAGGVQFWMALGHITPEMGSIQYLSGSHREAPLGAVGAGKGYSLVDEHPWLLDKYEISPAEEFHPGDVVAHASTTVHFAAPNRTDQVRWVHNSQRYPANTLFTGLRTYKVNGEYVLHPTFDGFGFEPFEPMDHPMFPVVSGAEHVGR